ncbi:MAG: extracellular solute-binding protein [Pseudomonadota bacterium]
MTRTLCAALALAVATPAMADGVIVSHGLSTFGDLAYGPDFSHFEYVNPEAPQGGTMSFRGFLASRTFDSLNQFILAGESAQGLERLYDSLMVRAFDEPDALYGQIGETVEYPADRSWVIFNMRPEATFSDGHPITAEDVVFTIDALKTEGHPYYRITLADVEGAEALSDHRVRVNFRDGANTRDLGATVAQLYVLPAHYYDTVPFAESTMEPPVGSGKYLVKDADPGRQITYCQNPDYWGKDLNVNVGMENFECFVYEYFADNTAAFEALKSGEYLFHEEFTSAQWASAYDFPALDEGHVIREVIEDARPAGAQGYWLNTRHKRFQDIRVREAVGMLFNFEWTNETLFAGLYQRSDSVWENAINMQAEGRPEGDELALLEEIRDLLPPEVFEEAAYVPPVSEPIPSDRRQIRAAGRLLDEAGWMVGDDGMRRNAAGDTLKLEFLFTGAGFQRIVLPFIENLRRAGIDASENLIDAAQYEQRLEDFAFDMVIARPQIRLSPSVELRSLFGSAGADQPGTLNLSGLSDPAIDALIERVISASDRQSMETAVRALDRVVRHTHVWVPNWYKGTHWIAYWDVFGKPAEKPAYVRGDDYWWFDQAKYDALIESGVLR